MRSVARIIAVIAIGLTGAGRADQVFPAADWKDVPTPLASPHAVVGGEIRLFAGAYPESFNYYLANNTLTRQVFTSMFESLLTLDPVTAEYAPGLAARWSISDDLKTFTFWLDDRARWSDGCPVTADDVKWTFDTIMASPLTGVHKVPLEAFSSPEVVSSNVVRFTASEVHWRNLGAASGFEILPKHAYADMDFGKLNFEFPVVSGASRLGELKEGISVVLERRDDWWGRAYERNRNLGNFERVLFRFYEERANAFAAFKKGLIDVYPVYTSRLWMNATRGKAFERSWIVKQKVHNHAPQGFQGFAMNMRRPPFDDVRVRKAMAHLLDREKMNRTLMYSQYFMQRSFFEDLYDKDHPCQNPLLLFDKEKARNLLAEAGWAVPPETGVLAKNGKPFSFTFLTRSQSSDKFLAIYNESLKDVGIEMIIERKDVAAWFKNMDEFNFDMTWSSWSAGIFRDPEGMWASAEAERRSGNNITGFRDPTVDELIEKQKTNFNLGERNQICREIDTRIATQVPYALLWNIDYVRLLYWNKFGTPPQVLSKFSNEDAAISYWWYDEDRAADLEAAMDDDEFLPPEPADVDFNNAFKR